VWETAYWGQVKFLNARIVTFTRLIILYFIVSKIIDFCYYISRYKYVILIWF
jgi:hypothetical protein